MTPNIVFDMGKVLLDYQPIMPCLRYTNGCMEDALILRKAIFECKEWVGTDIGDVTDDELAQIAAERVERPDLKALVPQIVSDWHLDTLWPIPGMSEIIEDLHQQGKKLYILSNASLRFRAYQYKIPHVDWFSGILVSAEERLLKPDPAIYRRLLKKFGLKAEECLFIDDVEENVEGAKSVGMQGYWHRDMDVAALRRYLG